MALAPAQMLGVEIVIVGESGGGCEIKNDWLT